MGLVLAFGILFVIVIVGGEIFDIDDWKRR